MRVPHTPNSLITFLIIGAQKAGTSWLDAMLRFHPDIFLPETKELHFFDWTRHYKLGPDWYVDQFTGWNGEAQVGEATPDYMWSHHSSPEADDPTRHYDVPEKVHHLLPDIKLIASLRNPVDRAISAFHHNRTRGRIPVSASILDVKDHFGIVSQSLYDLQLEEWFAQFEQDRFCFLIYEEDIKSDGAKTATLNSVCSHLGLPRMPDELPITQRVNARQDAALAYLNRVPLLRDRHRGRKLAQTLNSIIPKPVQGALSYDVPSRDKDYLRELFEPNIRRLESLIGRKTPW